MKYLLLLFSSALLAYGIEVGEVPSAVVLQGKDGGKVAGGKFDTRSLKGKVTAVFYVDPDVKDKNQALVDALANAKLNHDKYQSVAIVNLAATWKPNFVIEAILKRKQHKYPKALYVKDRRKVLVKRWGLKDDDSDILVFDADGKLIFKKEGKLSNEEIAEVLKLIKSRI